VANTKTVTASGPVLVTGGEFGPEASIVSIVACVIPAAILLLVARRRGLIRPMRRAADTRPPAV
jgi:hypothetical protein